MFFKKKLSTYLFFALIAGSVLLFYFYYNPQSKSFLIKCPFKFFTGLDCPGCGSQRALHSLLHGEIKEAFYFNPLFILAIPYLLTGILFEWFGLKEVYPKTRKFLFGRTAILIIATVIIFFFIFRNL